MGEGILVTQPLQSPCHPKISMLTSKTVVLAHPFLTHCKRQPEQGGEKIIYHNPSVGENKKGGSRKKDFTGVAKQEGPSIFFFFSNPARST